MSYNDSRLVRGLYKGFKMRPTKVRYSVGSRVHKRKRGLFGELIITNY